MLWSNRCAGRIVAALGRLAEECRPNGLSSGFEDGEHLPLSHDVVETNENRFEFPGRRGGNRDFHLHRFDEYDVIAVADASPDLDRKRADAPGDLGHNLDVWHSVLRDSLRAYGDRNTRKYRNARKSKGGRPRLSVAPSACGGRLPEVA